MPGTCFCRLFEKKKKANRQPSSEGVPSYAFEVLAKATGNFSNNNRLGEGGYGQVYKGKLPNGKVVAIKRLIHHSDSDMEENAQLQFEEEVKTISRIRHRNIVEVVGYCSNKADRLLVYEFVSNNSLKYHLRGKTSHGMESPAIDWPSRMKIALGTAKGLAYLHEDCKPRIIHRDIKSDNILRYDIYELQIGDFGISKDFADSATHVFTEPRGTVAYAPPEYYNKDGQNRILTDKSDVFSFGIVLLELITRKLAIFMKKPLAIWAMPLLKQVLDTNEQDLDAENCKDLFDSKLQKEYNKDEMIRMIYCVAACLYKPMKLRPQMSQIVEVLKKNMEPKNIWDRNDSKYLYEGSPYAPLPQQISDS
ncbi:proline-rich receptor-like protein kinase PERK15 [Hevea brasiliensis]|uniref:proline-rich receptor-like protein kinase PERK15 n=1 Tax=Hevea brasiliensis TaxID=3981 RepID=UPI0025CC2AE1|nr:proline-rich receptor-like protein kinase PERK15 [Hevea brasiliensis]